MNWNVYPGKMRCPRKEWRRCVEIDPLMFHQIINFSLYQVIIAEANVLSSEEAEHEERIVKKTLPSSSKVQKRSKDWGCQR